jgi:hypothetical protein
MSTVLFLVARATLAATASQGSLIQWRSAFRAFSDHRERPLMEVSPCSHAERLCSNMTISQTVAFDIAIGPNKIAAPHDSLLTGKHVLEREGD